MGSYMDYKSFGDGSGMDGVNGKPDFPITRQSSILGLTFDELQSTFSGLGKDFGSMNMDELLKSIWSAEETQNVSLMSGNSGEGTNVANGGLQKQGSLTLPRTISQKKVDDVWRDLFVENVAQKDGIGMVDGRMNSLERRQQTLGEITLEEFLFRAGVVKEDDPKPSERMNVNGFHNQDALPMNDNASNRVMGINFQQPNQHVAALANSIVDSNVGVGVNMSRGYALNNTTVRPSLQVQVKPQNQNHLPIFPKQTNLSFASPARHLATEDLRTSTPMNRVVAGNHTPISPHIGTGLDLSNMARVRGDNVKIPVSTTLGKNVGLDIIGQDNVDSSSPYSSSPYAYSGMRGRKRTATLEKAIERRNRRMIKNRESAARSRARKQAYTTELEEEIARLKEANEEMQKKQAEILEMQKNQMVEKMRQQWGGKRIHLKRTLTGPW